MVTISRAFRGNVVRRNTPLLLSFDYRPFCKRGWRVVIVVVQDLVDGERGRRTIVPPELFDR